MAEKGTKAKASAPATAPGNVMVEVLHPITYQDSQYSRGLHRLAPNMAEFFLNLRVPNRVSGPQPVARLPLPAERRKKGTVTPLEFRGD